PVSTRRSAWSTVRSWRGRATPPPRDGAGAPGCCGAGAPGSRPGGAGQGRRRGATSLVNGFQTNTVECEGASALAPPGGGAVHCSTTTWKSLPPVTSAGGPASGWVTTGAPRWYSSTVLGEETVPPSVSRTM